MTSQDASAAAGAGSVDVGDPNCPQCRSRMKVRQISPALTLPKIDDVVYGCERCGTEAKHTVKRA
jgi:hypothetical protein